MNDSLKIHLNILDKERLEILPKMAEFSHFGFYLAGGTGLALQIGHRDSVDFDFFKDGDFDVNVWENKIKEIFQGFDILIFQKDKNTLSFTLNQKVKFSFFGYDHKLLYGLNKVEYFDIASVRDIACMKFSAILSRSLEKDYVDLYFIMKIFSLNDLLLDFKEKYPTIDIALVLKSLTYFEDVLEEPIIFKEGHGVSFEVVKTFLKEEVKRFF